jgi:hypothetical protein
MRDNYEEMLEEVEQKGCSSFLVIGIIISWTVIIGGSIFLANLFFEEVIMDFLPILFSFLFGVAAVIIWDFIIKAHQELNRQDYITKIGLLKREVTGLVSQAQHTQNLLDTANDDCHRMQKRLIEYSYKLDMQNHTID